MFILSDNVKSKIKDFLDDFEKWLKTEEGQESLKEREEREKKLKSLLDLANFDKFTEFEYKEIIASLWAYAGWGNKEYVASRVLKGMKFDIFKSELKNLLYGSDPLSKRYDRFFEKVKGIGPAGITEILAFIQKEQYGIWNDKSRKALKMLGLEKEIPVDKYKINGSEYEKINDVLKSIFEIIKPEKKECDLLYVDLFLYYIAIRPVKKEEIEEIIEEDYQFDHDEIVDKLIGIGEGLGFEVESDKLIAKGAKVDVIWQTKIANLGIISYVFEVQRGGSIDSLILNLQRAKNNPTVQKLIIVANRKDIKRIKDEVESLSEDFRKSLTYWEVIDVEKAYDLLTELTSIINKLELVKTF